VKGAKKVLETILTGLMGAIVGILLVNAYRVFNETTISLALFGLFLYIMAIIYFVRFASLKNEVTDIVSKGITSRLLKGRPEIYLTTKRIYDSSKKGTEIMMLAVGADLSNERAKKTLTPYLKSIEKALKRGTIFFRVQTIDDAPVAWLQYIYGLLSRDEYRNRFNLRVIKGDSEGLLQLIAGEDEMVIVPLETKIEEPVAIEVFDKDATKSFRSYFKSELWENSRIMETDDLGKQIGKLIVLRKKQMKVAIANYIKNQLIRREEFLDLPTADKAKKALGILVFDEFIYQELRDEAKKLVRKLENVSEHSLQLEEIDSWLKENTVTD